MLMQRINCPCDWCQGRVSGGGCSYEQPGVTVELTVTTTVKTPLERIADALETIAGVFERAERVQ